MLQVKSNKCLDCIEDSLAVQKWTTTTSLTWGKRNSFHQRFLCLFKGLRAQPRERFVSSFTMICGIYNISSCQTISLLLHISFHDKSSGYKSGSLSSQKGEISRVSSEQSQIDPAHFNCCLTDFNWFFERGHAFVPFSYSKHYSPLQSKVSWKFDHTNTLLLFFLEGGIWLCISMNSPTTGGPFTWNIEPGNGASSSLLPTLKDRANSNDSENVCRRHCYKTTLSRKIGGAEQTDNVCLVENWKKSSFLCVFEWSSQVIGFVVTPTSDLVVPYEWEIANEIPSLARGRERERAEKSCSS